MTAAALAAPAAEPTGTGAPPVWHERPSTWIGVALSVGVLGSVLVQLGSGGLARITAAASGSPVFWAVFVLAYAATPACEWVIFRRLWALPVSGLTALLRKEVSNELLFGYAGEAQFYLWARRHVTADRSPFGAVKDVAVLSALAGNLAALVMMAASAPLLAGFAARPGAWTFVGAVATSILISLGLFVFRRAVFSLPAAKLRMIFLMHGVRIALHVGFAALMWHLLLPSVSLASWMALATVRQMVTRLPLVSNKDVLFAGLTMVLLGSTDGVAAAIAAVSTLTVGAHFVVGLAAHGAPLAFRRRVA